MVVKELEMLPAWAGRAQEYDVDPPIDAEPEPAAVVVDVPDAEVEVIESDVDPSWPAPEVADDLDPEPEPVVDVVDPEPEPEPVADVVDPEPEAEPVVDVVEPEPELEPIVEFVDPEPEPEPIVEFVDPEPEPEPIVEVEPAMVEHEPTVETPVVDEAAAGVFLGAETASTGPKVVVAHPRRRGRLLLVLILLSIIAGVAAGYLYTVFAA